MTKPTQGLPIVSESPNPVVSSIASGVGTTGFSETQDFSAAEFNYINKVFQDYLTYLDKEITDTVTDLGGTVTAGTSKLLSKALLDKFKKTAPVGSIILSPSIVAFDGYLRLDGSDVDQNTYSDLADWFTTSNGLSSFTLWQNDKSRASIAQNRLFLPSYSDRYPMFSTSLPEWMDFAMPRLFAKFGSTSGLTTYRPTQTDGSGNTFAGISAILPSGNDGGYVSTGNSSGYAPLLTENIFDNMPVLGGAEHIANTIRPDTITLSAYIKF